MPTDPKINVQQLLATLGPLPPTQQVQLLGLVASLASVGRLQNTTAQLDEIGGNVRIIVDKLSATPPPVPVPAPAPAPAPTSLAARERDIVVWLVQLLNTLLDHDQVSPSHLRQHLHVQTPKALIAADALAHTNAHADWAYAQLLSQQQHQKLDLTALTRLLKEPIPAGSPLLHWHDQPEQQSTLAQAYDQLCGAHAQTVLQLIAQVSAQPVSGDGFNPRSYDFTRPKANKSHRAS